MIFKYEVYLSDTKVNCHSESTGYSEIIFFFIHDK